MASVGNVGLDVYCQELGIVLDERVRADIDEQVRRAAYYIIEGKGATYYGIGSALAYIVNTILRDQRSVMTVCTPMADIVGVPDVTVALPHLVGGQGVIATLPYPLAEEECAALKRSAGIVKEAIVGMEEYN